MKIMKKHHNSNNSFETRRNSTLSSCDEVKVTNGSSKMHALYQPSAERCDLCEEVFNNKYEMLVHNASHIVIPLLKQKTYQCEECLHHFTTLESLDLHCVNKHQNSTQPDVPEILRSFVKKEPKIIVKTPLEINNAIVKKESLLQSLVKREPITVLTKENFVLDEPGDVFEISDDDVFSPMVKYENDEDIIIKKDIDMCVDVNFDMKMQCDENGEDDNNVNVNSKGIKDRLTFEDEGNDEPYLNVMNDLTKNCNVDLELLIDKNFVKRLQKPNVANGNLLKNKSIVPELVENNWKSIHYDDLIETGEYSCEKCERKFSNRYECIIHETVHINIKKPKRPFLCRYCDWYVSTSPMGLRSHQRRHHPDADEKYDVQECNDCGLFYVQRRRHVANYHNSLDPGGNEASKSPEQKSIPIDELQKSVEECSDQEYTWQAKMLQVCDLCYSFLRDKSNLTYEYFGVSSEMGKRSPCDRCQKQCFTLKLVRRHNRKRNTQVGVIRPYVRKKALTNTERLKNLQQRLKKIKNMNKY